MTATMEAAREFRRTHDGLLTCVYGEADEGRAAWLNVSRTGAAVRLGRYVRPGRFVTLRFVSPVAGADTAYHLAGQVVWCRPESGSETFVAGLWLRRTCPEAAAAFSAIGAAAARQANSTGAAEVGSPVWTHLRPSVDESTTHAATAPAARAV